MRGADLSSLGPSLLALPSLQEILWPRIAAIAPAAQVGGFILGLKATKALVAPRERNSLRPHERDLVRLSCTPGLLCPWADLPVLCQVTSSEPYSYWRAIWGFKQPAHHEPGLRAQQPGTVLLPLSTPWRPQRPGRWWGNQLLLGRISSLISLCFPEGQGPHFRACQQGAKLPGHISQGVCQGYESFWETQTPPSPGLPPPSLPT